MYFVDKKTLEKQLYISPQFQDIIKHPQQFSYEEKQSLFQLLTQYKDQCWISCSCNIPYSLLVICILGDYIYIRCKSKEMHLPSCHFFLVGKITLNASAPQNVMPDARLLKYNLYTSPSKLKSPSTSHTNNTPITFRSVSRLGQALYTVLTDSKINIINIPVVNRSLFEQLQNITLSFNDPHKLIGKNITLHKFYRYSLTQKNLQSSENILINASPAFSKGLRPFMLFTTIANSISNNTMTTKSNTTFTIKNTIALPSTWINIYKSAPYFVLGFVKFSNEAI